jgi:hypothetical protein
VENLNYEGMPLKIVYKGKRLGDEMKFSGRNLYRKPNERT